MINQNQFNDLLEITDELEARGRMKKVAELEGAELAEWVARAQGWTPNIPANDDPYWENDQGFTCYVYGYRPDLNWSQAGGLVEKYVIGSEGGSAWIWTEGKCIGMTGPTPQIAICRAVVASVYGEEVDDSEDKSE